LPADETHEATGDLTTCRDAGHEVCQRIEETIMETASQNRRAGQDLNSTQVAAVRGPLRYEVETSSPLVEAGRPFSIFLRVTNPYEVAVEITRVEFLLPVEFINETMAGGDASLQWRSQFQSAPAKAGGTVNPFERQIAVAVNGRSRTGTLGGSTFQKLPPSEADAPRPFGETSGEDGPTGAQGPSDPETSVTIQPGNTTVQMVSLRTHRWLLFSPAVYQLEAQIHYRLDGQYNTDAAKVPLNVKAPLPALMAGAAAGAVLGGVVGLTWQSLANKSPLGWPQALANVVLSLIVIVAFARKKDAQPFISIEDFYGGLFVGFTVGVAGEDWLSWLMNSATPPDKNGAEAVTNAASAVMSGAPVSH